VEGEDKKEYKQGKMMPREDILFFHFTFPFFFCPSFLPFLSFLLVFVSSVLLNLFLIFLPSSVYSPSQLCLGRESLK